MGLKNENKISSRWWNGMTALWAKVRGWFVTAGATLWTRLLCGQISRDYALQGSHLSSVVSTHDGATDLRQLGCNAFHPTSCCHLFRFLCGAPKSIHALPFSVARRPLLSFRSGTSIGNSTFAASPLVCAGPFVSIHHVIVRALAVCLSSPWRFMPVLCFTTRLGLPCFGPCSRDFFSPVSELDGDGTLSWVSRGACRQWCYFLFACNNAQGLNYLRIGVCDCTCKSKMVGVSGDAMETWHASRRMLAPASGAGLRLGLCRYGPLNQQILAPKQSLVFATWWSWEGMHAPLQYQHQPHGLLYYTFQL